MIKRIRLRYIYIDVQSVREREDDTETVFMSVLELLRCIENDECISC